MAIKCGTDIVYIPAIAKLLKDELMLSKFFHPSELTTPELSTGKVRASMEHLAGVIAAKEAYFKALGIIPKFSEIQLAHEASGRPMIVATTALQTYKSCDVSISHDHDYAIAMVILEV